MLKGLRSERNKTPVGKTPRGYPYFGCSRKPHIDMPTSGVSTKLNASGSQVERVHVSVSGAKTDERVHVWAGRRFSVLSF